MSCVLFNLQGAYRFAVVFATAYLIYHTFIGLSRTFLKFFNFLFSSSAPTATACISYHITSALSIPFSKLFQVFSISLSKYLHRLICDSLHILPYTFPFVKHFCITFSIFFDYFQQITTYTHLSTAFPQPYPQFVLCFFIKSSVFGPSRTPVPTAFSFYNPSVIVIQ